MPEEDLLQMEADISETDRRVRAGGRHQVRQMIEIMAESVRLRTKAALSNSSCVSLLVDDKEPWRVVRYKRAIIQRSSKGSDGSKAMVKATRGLLGVVSWLQLIAFYSHSLQHGCV